MDNRSHQLKRLCVPAWRAVIMPLMSRAFCRIVTGAEPSQTIHEDEHAIAFLNLARSTRGHTCQPNLAGS